MPESLRVSYPDTTSGELVSITANHGTRQVICHITDFEPVYADRMKRIIVEENPMMFGGDPLSPKSTTRDSLGILMFILSLNLDGVAN